MLIGADDGDVEYVCGENEVIPCGGSSEVVRSTTCSFLVDTVEAVPLEMNRHNVPTNAVVYFDKAKGVTGSMG